MRVLIDTNVLIDYVDHRLPYFDNAQSIFDMCSNNKVSGYISAHSVLDICYILRKMPLEDRLTVLSGICKIFDIISVDKAKILSALNSKGFKDMEDCVISECALSVKADHIITRNIKDFANSAVKPILPEDFLELF